MPLQMMALGHPELVVYAVASISVQALSVPPTSQQVMQLLIWIYASGS
jgi:hypothetical protein